MGSSGVGARGVKGLGLALGFRLPDSELAAPLLCGQGADLCLLYAVQGAGLAVWGVGLRFGFRV